MRSFCCLCPCFSKNASKPTSSWSVVVFRHCVRVDVFRAVCTLFVVCASVFQKCTRTDLFGECRCFPLPCPCLLSRQATCARFFCCWRSVLIENARKQALLGLVFSCFAFLMFLFSGNRPERVCAAVPLRAFILFASFLSDSAPRRRTQAGFAGRTCIGSACAGLALPDRLCRVGFSGSALPG